MAASEAPFDEPFPTDSAYPAKKQPPVSVLPLLEQFLDSAEARQVLRINPEKVSQLAEDIGGELLQELADMDSKNKKVEAAPSAASAEVSASPAAPVEAGGSVGLCAATSPSPDSAKEDKFSQIARVLAYNVMNFSFYPEDGQERWFIEGDIGKDDEALAVTESLRRWEQSGHYKRWLRSEANAGSGLKHICWADSAYMLSLTLTDMEDLFKPATGAGHFPLLDLRLKCLHSLAEGLYSNGGTVSDFLRLCEESSVQDNASPACPVGQIRVGHFVSSLCSRVPAFRDLRYFGEVTLEFAKRPQLTIGMLHGDGLVKFADIENLTVFSDYRLPQLFRSKGAMEVLSSAGEVAESGKVPLSAVAHSTLEIAIRAATLIVGEHLRKQLSRTRGKPVLGADLDYFLWRKTVELDGKGELFPFHRTRTFSY